MWIKLDDQIAHHPKFMTAGPVASWLWVCGQSHCARYLTDGFIPASCLAALGSVTRPERYAERLVAVGLWERVDGGFRVHDYEVYQPTGEQVVQRRERRSEAGRRGGLQSGASRRSKREATVKQSASGLLQSNEANASSNREANANPVPVPSTSPSIPNGILGEGEAASLPPAPPPAEPATKPLVSGVAALVALWNTTTTPPIARCRELTPERRKRAALRLKERPLAEWCTVFERIERSPFCRGVNDRGWVASFDWIVRGPESAVRVLEGKYDGRQGVETTAAREAPPIWQTVLDRLQSRLCQRDLITWFRPLVCVRDDGDQIVLRAGETVVAYLRKHFTSAFTDALHEARPDLRVEWQVTEEVA